MKTPYRNTIYSLVSGAANTPKWNNIKCFEELSQIERRRELERGKSHQSRNATWSWGKTMVKKMETRNRCGEKRRVENTQVRARRYTGLYLGLGELVRLSREEREEGGCLVYKVRSIIGGGSFCPAAGTGSCGDSPFKRTPKNSFGKSSYGLCHPSDDGSFPL